MNGITAYLDLVLVVKHPRACMADIVNECIIYRIRFNFRGVKLSRLFADQQPFAKVSSRENLDLSGNESAFVRRLRNKHPKMAAIR